MNTFMAAIESGINTLTEHADALDSAEDPNTQLISIKEWREAGIMPLASGRDRK
jgi:hypothetical protein